MTTITHHPSPRHRTEVTWIPVSGVQPPVFIGRADDQALAIIEMLPTTGFRLTTCRGERLGDFASLLMAQAAFVAWVSRR